MKDIRSYMSSQKIFLNVIFLLIIGLFSIKLFFPSPVLWIFSFVIILFFLLKVIINYKDPFGFLLILFFLSHFSYVDNQGGLWNISAFTVYIIIILSKRKQISFKTDRTSLFLLISLLLVNLVGWTFYSDSSITLRIQGFIMLSSYMLTFIFVSNIKITPVVLKRFFNLLFIISIYLFFAAINQRIGIIDSKLPLLPPKSISQNLINLTSNSSSTFANSELYGEYCVLILILTLSVSLTKANIKLFFSKKYYSIIIILMMIFGCFLSGSRSSVLLAFSSLFIVGLKSVLSFKKSNNLFKLLTVLSAISLFSLFIFDFGYQSTLSDFQKLESLDYSVDNIISGESINRYELFKYAIERINSENWLFGKGYGPLESNILAWWGYTEDTPYVDFHNLYYTMIMVYGYLGLLIFLSLVIRIIILSVKAKFFKINANYLNPILTVIPLFWIIFLIDQWKISILRNPNFHMIIWIFLGLSMAIIKTKKYKT